MRIFLKCFISLVGSAEFCRSVGRFLGGFRIAKTFFCVTAVPRVAPSRLPEVTEGLSSLDPEMSRFDKSLRLSLAGTLRFSPAEVALEVRCGRTSLELDLMGISCDPRLGISSPRDELDEECLGFVF